MKNDQYYVSNNNDNDATSTKRSIRSEFMYHSYYVLKVSKSSIRTFSGHLTRTNSIHIIPNT